MRKLFLLNRHFNRIAQWQSVHFDNIPEYIDPVWLPIQGTLPSWLNGTMYRVGPGRFTLENDMTIRHAFDGIPFVHRFQFDPEQQRVRYNSRNIAKKAERNLVDGKPTILFGHIDEQSMMARLACWLRRTHYLLKVGLDMSEPSSQMVGVTPTPNYPLPRQLKKNTASHHEPTLVTKTDANILQKIHVDTLEPEQLFRYNTYGPELGGDLAAAHHQHDPDTEEIFNFTLTLGLFPKLTVFSCTKDGTVTVYATITKRTNGTPLRPSYIHSFWLTKHYIILPEAPLYFGGNGATMMASGSVSSSLVWDNHGQTYLHVISRRPDVGLVASIPVHPFFTFHVGNAWEAYDSTTKQTTLVLDCAAFPDGDIVHQVHTFGHQLPLAGPKTYRTHPASVKEERGFYLPPARQSSFGDLVRLSVQLGGKIATMAKLASNVEFLRFNPMKALKPYRYVFANQLVTATNKTSSRYNLVKIDTQTLAMTAFDEQHQVCSEPIFVPRPDATGEDDGVVLSLVNVLFGQSGGQPHCYLLVLDAATMTEVARCPLGHFSNITFHGSYVDQDYQSVSIN
ncbi:hypothetical protein DM01DRAFT_1293510 [Hesseltinella vesiculosa]|uniref:Carotenoid oxygenase n=1 Tax=Hesseltinella vesiculosa TaxID=101127 RepID=A0A1X2G8A6_9FUNG|nr:hypothetical protein DM01DRAFT_1293510 [Hesseltinella vesiculosa]